MSLVKLGNSLIASTIHISRRAFTRQEIFASMSDMILPAEKPKPKSVSTTSEFAINYEIKKKAKDGETPEIIK